MHVMDPHASAAASLWRRAGDAYCFCPMAMKPLLRSGSSPTA